MPEYSGNAPTNRWPPQGTACTSPASLLRVANRSRLPARTTCTPASTCYNHSPVSRRLWPYYLQRSLRAASTIAAVIGLVFLLSGILPTLHFGRGTATSSGNIPVPSSTQHVPPSTTTTQKAAADHQSNSNGVRTPTALPKNTPGTQRPTSEAPPALLPPDLNTGTGRQEVGWLLIALSIVGILLTRRKRRRLET